MNTKTCECTTACGDDPNVTANLVLGCAKYRARRQPEHLAATNIRLRESLADLVDLMDRLEPYVDDDVREQAEAEWDELKAAAAQLLAETE